MKFVMLLVAMVTVSLSVSKLPGEKKCVLKGKTRGKDVCKGKLIILTAEMARVASVERGNCVCLFHWNQLKARNKLCSCPLPTHSSRISHTPIPAMLYSVMDEAGKKVSTYWPGTKWCTSCRKNAEKIFSTMDHYQTPSKRKLASSIGVKFIIILSFKDSF